MGSFKKIISFLLILVLLISFCSCSNENYANSPINANVSSTNNSGDKSNEVLASNETGEKNDKYIENDILLSDYIENNPVNEIQYVDTNNRSMYNIDCFLDTEKKVLSCRQTINYVNNTGADLNDLALHLYPDYYSDDGVYATQVSSSIINNCYGNIAISLVDINSKSISFTQDNEILKFELPDILKKYEKLDIIIEFDLTIPSSVERMSYYENTYSLVYWYPIVCYYNVETNGWDERPYYYIGESNYGYYNDYNVNITVPKDYVVVATGVEVETENVDNGLKTINAKESNVKDFVFFASPDYECKTVDMQGITVNTYYFAGHEATNQRIINYLKEGIDFMTKAVGKYPFNELDIVESPMDTISMEYPTVINMAAYNDDTNTNINARKVNWLDDTIIHELIHQWWFNVVGNNSYDEAFMDESLAVCWTNLFFEFLFGSENPETVYSLITRKNYMDMALYPINKSVESFQDSDSYSHTLCLGYVVLEDLRKQVGNEKFVEVFRKLYEDFRFTNATSQDLIDIVGEICGDSYKEFLDNSINKQEYDVYRFYEATHK